MQNGSRAGARRLLENLLGAVDSCHREASRPGPRQVIPGATARVEEVQTIAPGRQQAVEEGLQAVAAVVEAGRVGIEIELPITRGEEAGLGRVDLDGALLLCIPGRGHGRGRSTTLRTTSANAPALDRREERV